MYFIDAIFGMIYDMFYAILDALSYMFYWYY